MKLSIIVPLLNEAENIPILYSKLVDVASFICSDFEIIFVDDGSKDKSLERIANLSSQDSRVIGIALSRNFGHQIALTAGIEHSKGEVVITLDADMQHPPELIAEMYQKYSEGYDVVNTNRLESDGASALKKLTSFGFYWLVNKLSDIHLEPGSADFRLMNRKTVDAFLTLKEKDRFVRGIISWLGFKQCTLSYSAPERFSGKSKYSLVKMIRFAADGITSFSAKPLRVSFYTGLFVSLLGLIYAVYAVVEFMKGNTIQGWTSILVSLLIIGGLQLISIGIIGEYLARVFTQTKNRPLYFVKEYISQNANQN